MNGTVTTSIIIENLVDKGGQMGVIFLFKLLFVPGAPSAIWRILTNKDSRHHFWRGYDCQ